MLKIFAIFDTKADALHIQGPNGLFLAATDAAAIRLFAEALAGDNNILNKYADDYNLYSLGELNPQTGAIQGEPAKLVMEGSVAKDLTNAPRTLKREK